ELEIPLYYPYRFLHRDYVVSGYGGMAFWEAGFHGFIAIVRHEPLKTKTAFIELTCFLAISFAQGYYGRLPKSPKLPGLKIGKARKLPAQARAPAVHTWFYIHVSFPLWLSQNL